MKKFVVIYHSSPEATAQWMNTSAEEKQAGMKPWMDWKAKNETHILDFGVPLMGGVKVNSDGSAAPTKNPIGGYSVLQGDSLAQVQVLLKDHPHNKEEWGMTVEVHESLSM